MQQEGKIKMWLDHVELEEQAMNQVRQAASLDIIDGMAIMPDCHYMVFRDYPGRKISFLY